MSPEIGLYSLLICPLLTTGFLSFAKYKYFALRGTRREELCRNQVGEGKEKNIPDQNPIVSGKLAKILKLSCVNIPPNMSIVVLVDYSDIRISIDKILAWGSACN